MLGTVVPYYAYMLTDSCIRHVYCALQLLGFFLVSHVLYENIWTSKWFMRRIHTDSSHCAGTDARRKAEDSSMKAKRKVRRDRESPEMEQGRRSPLWTGPTIPTQSADKSRGIVEPEGGGKERKWWGRAKEMNGKKCEKKVKGRGCEEEKEKRRKERDKETETGRKEKRNKERMTQRKK